MSLPVPSTSIDLEFADGTYTFKLGLKQIAELQTKCGCGIGALYARVLRGRYLLEDASFGHPAEAEYRVEDLTETIRLGLIGGGTGEVNEQVVDVTPIVANRLVQNYVADRPLSEGWSIAAAILNTAIEGYTPKKKADVTEEANEDQIEILGSTTPGPLPTAP
jgi:hypothetical protein